MKRRTNYFLVIRIVGVVLLLVLSCATASGQDASMKGLTGVWIRVELNETLLSDGLSKIQIKSDVDSQLRSAGIQVFTEKQWRSAEGHPQLYVEINGSKVEDNWKFYTFAVNIHLMQDVYIVRNNQTVLHQASTWFNGTTGLGYIIDIRSHVKTMVEYFSSVFLSVNPG
jgi:hypothetical protein